MKNSFRTIGEVVVLATAFLLMVACVDSMYDTNKGIDSTIRIGGDSLTFPIGSTDTIWLKNFLSKDDSAFLTTLENGGYGYTKSDSIALQDLLKELEVDKLKFVDQTFKQSRAVSFGDISLQDFVIPGYTRKDTAELLVPTFELGNLLPAVHVNQEVRVQFSDYALDPNTLNLPALNLETSKNGLLQEVSPFNTYPGTHPDAVPFNLGQDSVDIGNLSVMIHYSIDVPEGVTNIHQIDLEAGGQLEIELALEGVQEALSTGIFTPNITLDPTDLFKFGPLSPVSADGMIRFTAEDQLFDYNLPSAYSIKKTFQIDAIKNLPSASNKRLNISKSIGAWGKMTAEGVVKANKMEEANKINLIIRVKVRNLKIKNMDFDIPTFTTTIQGNAIVEMQHNELPKEIHTVNTLYFGKDPISSNTTNLVIQVVPVDLPTMKTSNYTVDQLEFTFPDAFVFGNMSGKTYRANNVTFDPIHGYRAELDVSELHLGPAIITNQTLAWNGDISYSSQLSIRGRMNSKEINTSKDPFLLLTTETAIQLKSADVTTHPINERFEPISIPLAFHIDIAEEAARLGVVNVKRGSFIRINIKKPLFPLELKGDQITIQFSDLYEFHPSPYLRGNTLQVPDDLPDFMVVELKTLHINKDLVKGKLNLTDTVMINGGISLLSGMVNSQKFNSLKNKLLVFETITSDIAIESTSIQLNTLEALYHEDILLGMEINDIPNEVVSLDSIFFKEGAKINLEVTLDNLPDLGANPLQANMVIQFPTLLIFTAGQVNANNELIVNQDVVNGKLTKRVTLSGLALDGKALNGKLLVDEKIKVKVKVSVIDPTINSDELNGTDIVVNATVMLSGLEFKSAYGKFNLDLEEQLTIPTIVLNDLPDLFKGDDVVIDINNPVISIVTESNTGIPMDASVSMTNYSKGTEILGNKLIFNFSLPRTASPSKFITSAYWVAPFESGMPTGHTFIQKDVQNLFNPLPDSIKLTIQPTINKEYQHYIDLAANYQLRVKYDIIIPFAFGKDFNVVLRDTIENIHLGLEDWDLSMAGVELFGEITNSIPLNMQLELLLMDEDFRLLAATEAIPIQAGALNGGGVKSDIIVRLTESGDNLNKTSKVVMIFRASSSSTIAGIPLKPDNFIMASLKSRIIGGVKVKL